MESNSQTSPLKTVVEDTACPENVETFKTPEKVTTAEIIDKTPSDENKQRDASTSISPASVTAFAGVGANAGSGSWGAGTSANTESGSWGGGSYGGDSFQNSYGGSSDSNSTPSRGRGRGRGGGGGGGTREGDWPCSCGANNFGHRRDCFKCHAPKPDGQDGNNENAGGDSYQSSYGSDSYSSAPSRGRGRGRGGGGGGGGDRNREGDWQCSCGINNFSFRRECFKCNAPKPDGQDGNNENAGGDSYQSSYGSDSYSSAPSRGRGRGRGGGDRNREGDWQCSCGVSNFAFRRDCFKCKAPKPGEGQEGNSENSGGGFGGDSYQSSFGNDSRPSRGPGRGRGGGDRNREGEWPCSSCGISNFAFRRDCFKCQKPKPSDAGGSSGGGRVLGQNSYNQQNNRGSNYDSGSKYGDNVKSGDFGGGGRKRSSDWGGQEDVPAKRFKTEYESPKENSNPRDSYRNAPAPARTVVNYTEDSWE